MDQRLNGLLQFLNNWLLVEKLSWVWQDEQDIIPLQKQGVYVHLRNTPPPRQSLTWPPCDTLSLRYSCQDWSLDTGAYERVRFTARTLNLDWLSNNPFLFCLTLEAKMSLIHWFVIAGIFNQKLEERDRFWALPNLYSNLSLVTKQSQLGHY